MTQKQISDIFGVSQRMVSKWKQKGAKLDDIYELAKWVEVNSSRKSEKLRSAIWRIKAERDGKKNQPGRKKGAGGIRKPKSEQERHSAEAFREYYAEQLAKAQDENNYGDIKYWNELFLKTDKGIREAEAHAKKLGIDRGEMLQRAEVERLIRNVIYAGNGCVRGVCKQMAERLAGMDDPAAIYKFMAPIILGGRLFEGFSKVSKAEGPTLCPDWLVDAVQHEGENYLKGVDVA